MNGMALVAIVAIAFALVVVFAALAFVRWSLRALERKDRAIEELRKESTQRYEESMERYARLVGQQIEATPRERQAERESAVHQARRQLSTTRIVENPEQAVEMPSPSEARFNERMIYEELAERSRWEPEGWGPVEPIADAPDADIREALYVDVGVEAAL